MRNYRRFIQKYLGFFLVVFFVHGCGYNSQVELSTSTETAIGIFGADYREKGAVKFEKIEGSLISFTGCEVKYTHYRPDNPAGDTMTILGHGFLRSRQRMEGMARHLASWGMEVVSVEFCNSKLWAGHHDRNGADMVAVSKKLGAVKSIYAGFSAGALAALVASDLDTSTQAFFGLDMVDNQSLGKQLAPKLRIPVYGLIADPSSCNAGNNGLDVYAAINEASVLKIEDATHCHFEFPFDSKCALVCGGGEKRYGRVEIQRTILSLTTALLLWQTGIETPAKSWWSPGSPNYKALIKAGYIKRIN
jgi:dienelactone hydrolase